MGFSLAGPLQQHFVASIPHAKKYIHYSLPLGPLLHPSATLTSHWPPSLYLVGKFACFSVWCWGWNPCPSKAEHVVLSHTHPLQMLLVHVPHLKYSLKEWVLAC